MIQFLVFITGIIELFYCCNVTFRWFMYACKKKEMNLYIFCSTFPWRVIYRWKMTNKGQINYQSSSPNQGYKTSSTFNFLFNVDILQVLKEDISLIYHLEWCISAGYWCMYILKTIGKKGKKYKIIDRVIAMCFFYNNISYSCIKTTSIC